MPRKPIGERPMTDAERQARCRAARAAGRPATRTRRPADHRGRARRWHDAVAELIALQPVRNATNSVNCVIFHKTPINFFIQLLLDDDERHRNGQ